MLIEWSSVIIEQFRNFLQGFLVFLPKLIVALIILLIGWFISAGIGKLVAEILKKIKFNKIFEKGVWKEALEKAEFRIDASGFIGAIIKWILVIVFLLAAVEILGLVKFAEFLINILNYLPNVIVAVLIFVVAVIIADIGEKIVRAGVEGARIGYGQLTGAIVKWSILIFAILAILIQLKVAADFVKILFIGFVSLIVLAGGIAFGLAGKEVAAEILEGLRKKFRQNK